MLDSDQHSHSIIISLVIAHEWFFGCWYLALVGGCWGRGRMMEVVVCIHWFYVFYFPPGCQKLHFEREPRAPLINSHNLLVKAGGPLSLEAGLPGVIIAGQFSPEMPEVKEEARLC